MPPNFRAQLWRREFRILLARLQESCRSHADHFPEVDEALRRLVVASDRELPVLPGTGGGRKGARGRPQRALEDPRHSIVKLRQKFHYQRLKRRAVEAEVNKLTVGKERGRLTIPWIARVCLSKPSGTARSFEEAHADLVDRGR